MSSQTKSEDGFEINNENKKETIQIDSIFDLMKIPYSILLSKKLIDYKGSYFNSLVNEIIHPLEKKNVKTVQINKKRRDAIINEVSFKISFETTFGQSIKIVGNQDFIGNWAEHKELIYKNGYWTYTFPPSKTEFEFKFLLYTNGSVIWESIPNRVFKLSKNVDIIENLINIENENGETESAVRYYLNNNQCLYDCCSQCLVVMYQWNV